MIYSIPLTDISATDLANAIFTVQGELRSIDPVLRYKESKVWAFDHGNAIIE